MTNILTAVGDISHGECHRFWGVTAGKTFSLVRILVGSWERWETEPGFLGVCTILCAVWMLTTERKSGAPVFSCPDFLWFWARQLMSYLPVFSILYLVMCKRVINAYLWDASWGAKCGYVKYFCLKNVNIQRKEWEVLQTVSVMWC